MFCIACGSDFSASRKNKRYCDELCRFHKLPFRAWDGEGYDKLGLHVFNILATNDEPALINPDGISTLQAFYYLTQSREKCINVWYFFDYDVNCILKDVPLHGESGSLEQLARDSKTRWRGWVIQYVPNKVFKVTRGSRRFVSYDCFGFFQKSFINACKSFKLDTSLIEKGKQDRGNFDKWSVDDVVNYNNQELILLKQLMTQERKNLRYHAPKRMWYGPGAVANQWLLKTVHVKERNWTNESPEMHDAILHAYFGGRIDVAEIGEFPKCHAYDIASAYPYAMTQIPEVSGWRYATGEPPQGHIEQLGLYHVTWCIPNISRWGPFPWRASNGSILYPPEGEGWYYGCEVLSARKLYDQHITIIEAWVPEVVPNSFPLRHHIQDAYDKRMELKNRKDPSELAYKLILNSMYGKFAQKRVNRTNNPPFQNYLWAGFTTAFARSMLLTVVARNPANVIAFATDSIFCYTPMLGYGKDGYLGHWQYEGCYPTLIVMPGVYALVKDGETEKYRQRGMPMPINYGHVLRKWGCTTKLNTDGLNEGVLTYKRFVTFRHAIAQNKKRWGYFASERRSLANVSMFGFAKRFPDPLGLFDEKWLRRNMLATPRPAGELMSHIYELPDFEDEVDNDEPELIL